MQSLKSPEKCWNKGKMWYNQNMIVPKVIKRSNRRSLAITIDEKGDLIVKAPYLMTLDEIFSFLNKKQTWIEDRQTRIKSLLSQNYQLVNYQKVLFLGKQYQVCYSKGIETPYLTQDALILNYTKSLAVVKAQIKEFLTSSCDDILIPRISKIASKIGVFYKSIKIVSSKVKWGMCDNNHNLYFNFKLLMLSPQLIDYVIVHELCHIRQLNHSPKFWKLVGKYMPDYKDCQKQMKDCGFIIKLF